MDIQPVTNKSLLDHLKPTLPAIIAVVAFVAIVALVNDTLPEKKPKEEVATAWAGLVTVGKFDGEKMDVGILQSAEIGLRSDGVVVWRFKDGQDNQAKK